MAPAVSVPQPVQPAPAPPFVGVWDGDPAALQPAPQHIARAIQDFTRPVYVVDGPAGLSVTSVGEIRCPTVSDADGLPLRAVALPLEPSALGDPAFRAAHGVRYAYVAGAMANGIASVELVVAMAEAGMVGFFGAAGLELAEIERAIHRIRDAVGERPFGFNLIHSPHDPALEDGTVDLYLRHGVERVSASAYLGLTLPLVRYRVSGIHRGAGGRVVVPNQVFAKVSRVEVARHFLSPPPEKMLAVLVEQGHISPEQAALAGEIPMAEDITAEADSGGHTDNRPALALIPTLVALRDELQAVYGFVPTPRIGAAGGIATPVSVTAAFAMGAAYVLTGSINQACVEAGTSPAVKQMLAEAGQADVMMAPAADMFEMGVQVQVLKRGTMFALRARKLYELYRGYASLEEIPADVRAGLERDYFRASLDQVWAETRAFFARRDPAQIERAERDSRHRMALVFRSYLGRSSNWANLGEPSRKADYQIWCGPAMGAFNEWARGSILESAVERRAPTIAINLLAGAASLSRANALRMQGLTLPPEAVQYRPRPRTEIPTARGAT